MCRGRRPSFDSCRGSYDDHISSYFIAQFTVVVWKMYAVACIKARTELRNKLP
jgi:hypothetical protein